MTNEPIGLLAVFVYFAAVVLSLPASAAVLLLSRRVGIERAAAVVGSATLAVVAIGALGVVVVAGFGAGGTVVVYGVAALAVLWALPVVVGRWFVRRGTGLAADLALGYTVAGLPLALVASAAWFVAPGGPTRYNLTFLSGPALWAATAVLLAIVLLGPGLTGLGLVRLVGRLRTGSAGRS